MPVPELNHYVVRANVLEGSKRVDCDILGFEVMPMPGFRLPVSRVLAGGGRQGPGPHGPPRDCGLGSLRPRHDRQLGDGQHRQLDHIALLATHPSG